jgi:hypothetical protein
LLDAFAFWVWASHRDQEIRASSQFFCQALRFCATDIYSHLMHRLDHFRMDAAGWMGPG